jgi:hypothetical protein
MPVTKSKLRDFRKARKMKIPKYHITKHHM